LAIKYLAGERLIGTAAERTALTTLGSAGWTTQTEGTLSVAVDATNNELDFNSGFSTSQLGAGSYDLQSAGGLGSGNNASNSTWVLRFKVSPTGNTLGEDNNLTMMISKTQNAKTTTSTDRIGFLLYAGGTYWSVNDFGNWTAGTQFWTDDAAWGGSLVTHTSTLTRNADPIYVTITRTSTTGATISISANSDYTTSAYSISTTAAAVPSSVQDLRYITFQSASHATSSNRFEGNVTDIKFWNATTSTSGTPTKTFSFTNSYPNLTNGTLFEESDTGKHYMWDGTDTWNVM
jgi:hypothetical protein